METTIRKNKQTKKEYQVSLGYIVGPCLKANTLKTKAQTK